MKEAVIGIVVTILALVIMFQIEPTSIGNPPKSAAWTGPQQIIVMPEGAIQDMTNDYYFLRFYYKPNLDWDTERSLR